MSERVIDFVPGLVRGRKRDGRSIYDRTAKQELVRRCQQPGVSVAALALAHGLNANLLRKWITMAAGRRGSPQSAAAVLLPVQTERPASIAVPASVPADGYVEIVLAAGTIRLYGRVAAETLRMAIDGLSRRT
jgi:transposase-like protein